MDDTLDLLDDIRDRERRVVLATLVATTGGAPRRAGSRMLVGESGRVLGSVTIGGCVDVRVIEEAPRVLDGGVPVLLSLPLGDADAWELGMTCAGTVDVLVEPVDTRDDDVVQRASSAAREVLASGRSAAVVVPLRGASRRLVVDLSGPAWGTLGDDVLDASALDAARHRLAAGSSGVVALAGSEGTTDAFVEVLAPPTTLAVFGATHLAIPLVSMARTLGFRTVVVDAREGYATRERFPDADALHVGMPSEIAASLPLGRSTCVVLVAHDYKFDLPVLKEALASDAPYVGMLGSRRRGRATLDFLVDDGVAAEQLARVRVPIGLDIGAKTPAEIALSILAEVVAVRAGRPGTPMRERGERSAEG